MIALVAVSVGKAAIFSYLDDGSHIFEPLLREVMFLWQNIINSYQLLEKEKKEIEPVSVRNFDSYCFIIWETR